MQLFPSIAPPFPGVCLFMKRVLDILVLEDDPAEESRIEQRLQEGGWEVHAHRVDTPGAFADELQHHPDLIILDHGRPAFPSTEALSVARDEHPEVPCISLLDAENEQAIIEQFELGAKDCVLKAQMSNLVPAVQRCLELVQEDERLRQSQSEQRKFEKQLKLFVKASTDYAIYMLDPEGRVMSWNIAAHRLTGYEVEEVMGKHFMLFFTVEDLAQGKPQEDLLKAKSHGLAQSEGWIRRKDGSLVWVERSLTAVRAPDGTLLGYLKVYHDITQRERVEEKLQHMNEELERRVQKRTVQLQAANQELEAFSYSISHDLRAPLRHIKGFTEELQEHAAQKLDDDDRKCLEAIAQSANFLAALVDGLLNFSRLGRKSLHKSRVNLGALVQAIIHDLAPELAGREVDWQIGLLPEVEADPMLLRQVLLNLISNALKFTGHCARANIEINSISTGNEYTIFVRDNGAGFEMEFADRLFEVFHRLHTNEEFEGTGIGLAIVRRIIQRHGGRTWAEGKPNEGATIYFSLPK